MRSAPNDSYSWRIAAIRDESPTVKTISLEALTERPSFIPGQYLTVRLPGFEPAEGKSYSISSIPSDTYVTLSIKKIGAFSQTILAHSVGDTLTTSAPYGFFYPEDDADRDIALIAGGIGIAPVASIIREELLKSSSRNLFLLYSNRTVEESVFKDKLDILARTHPTFSPHFFLTREAANSPDFHEGRINAEAITNILRDPAKTDFFLCGSTEFTKGIWKLLRDVGIQSSQIYTEGFF